MEGAFFYFSFFSSSIGGLWGGWFLGSNSVLCQSLPDVPNDRTFPSNLPLGLLRTYLMYLTLIRGILPDVGLLALGIKQ